MNVAIIFKKYNFNLSYQGPSMLKYAKKVVIQGKKNKIM
jgi:hypothetical protein